MGNNTSAQMNIDIDLITACINKERKAEYELYKLTYRYLMSICVRYTRSYEEAQDGLNAGFMKILSNLDKYKTGVPFKAWIRKIMVNTLIDEYRKEKKHLDNIQHVENYAELPNMAEVNQAIMTMDVEQIHKYIMSLPPVSQKVFNLYVIDGFDHKEIARMLNMSEGTSKWHLHHSREQLKSMLLKMN
ncbi:MAG: RNA polymerase sigma factor [Bacteroidia bacterium]|nr:RNA polymerase sigma factor [Bacteroidia bacterium]